ncbi:MAG: hypothetical protein AB9869_05500 [Verrucomicrobiia bacterium]
MKPDKKKFVWQEGDVTISTATAAEKAKVAEIPHVCPHCGKPIDEGWILRTAARIRGAVGGRAGTGKSKARSRAQARKAVLTRWAKVRAARERGDLGRSAAGQG